MSIKVNAKVFNKRMKKLAGLPSYLIDEALDFSIVDFLFGNRYKPSRPCNHMEILLTTNAMQ